MHWYNNLAIFFGGAFFGNCLPHLINGTSGRPFQTPFAHPSGKGQSSSIINVFWGFFNLWLAYMLVIHFGDFHLHNVFHVLLFGAGMLLMSLFSAWHFGQFHGGR
jgi:hypothetical protein